MSTRPKQSAEQALDLAKQRREAGDHATAAVYGQIAHCFMAEWHARRQSVASDAPSAAAVAHPSVARIAFVRASRPRTV
jgi:hypothetical protein